MSATLGPNQTNISPGVPFFAPAGSSSGGSANPEFSTIRMAAGGFNSGLTATISFSSTLNITNRGGGVPVLAIGDSSSPDIAQVPFSTNYIQITSPAAFTGGVFVNIGASDGGSGFIACANSLSGVPSTLSLIADAVNISSLNVSSINGAAPGGGTVGPDLPLSTISFPIGNQTTQGIIRYTRLLTLDNSQTGNASDYILFTTTPGDQARTPLSTTTLLINSSSGGAASLAFGAGEDNNNYIISGLSGASVGQALAPLNVYATGLITSSITVSSINGITPLSGPETSTLQGQVRELRSSLGMI